MAITYIDTSALLKLLVEEEHTDDVRVEVASADLWSSTILGVEAYRASMRLGVPVANVERVLASVTLTVPSETTFNTAKSVGQPELRTLDALHLASALELQDDLGAIMTFDRRLAAAGAAANVAIISPGLPHGWWLA
jgi:uncharacterized protein